jgi:hypothetical protein
VVHRDLLTDDNEKSQSFIQKLIELLGMVEKAAKATSATTKAIGSVLTVLGIATATPQHALPPAPASISQPSGPASHAESTNGIHTFPIEAGESEDPLRGSRH